MRTVVVAALAAALLVSCGSGDPHDLALFDPQHVASPGAVLGMGEGSARPGRPYVFMLLPLCTKGAPAHVTSVRMLKSTGKIRLDDWALSPLRSQEAGTQKHARQLYRASRTVGVTQPCNWSTKWGLSVSLTYDGTAATGIDFVASGPQGSVTMPATITLCPQKSCTLPERDGDG